jgi:transcriptional regulator with XRE-family HTH domain
MAEKDDDGRNQTMGRMEEFSRDTPEEGEFLAGIPASEPEPAAHKGHGSLGQRVRRFRKEKDLSIAELSQSSGISTSELEDIEADRSNPPLGILIKLGKALGRRFGSLISGGRLRPYVVTKSIDLPNVSRLTGPRQTSYGYTYHSLAAEKKDRAMEPFLITLSAPKSEILPAAHGGEEFIYVLEGQMEAVVGEAKEVLNPGDSIYYDSKVPHLVRPHGEAPARILAVLFSPQD